MVDLLSYANTKRYHCVPIIGEQTVAAHSARVALLANQIMGGEASAQLLWVCLTHDLAECVTGDVPAPAKWRNEDLAAAVERVEGKFNDDNGLHVPLSFEERQVLKWADSLECFAFCIDQLMMGNRHVKYICENLICHLRDKSHVCMSEQVYEMLLEKYHGID